uniref:Uncharacterized protein n=1 Tax=Micrurus spixii TaxID=129469 RepID=A0A2D4MKA7_9SAUR
MQTLAYHMCHIFVHLKWFGEARRDYRSLAAQLNRKGIIFKWFVLEGMLITWGERKVKVDSMEKAQEFYEKLVGTEEQTGKDNSELDFQEEQEHQKKRHEVLENLKTTQQQQNGKERETHHQSQPELGVITRQRARLN